MSEPNEPLKGLIVPNTGDLTGAWGTTALNPNFSAIGGMLGGILTISLSAATTIALTAPSGSITPGAGPTQQQNALLRFTGSQTGTATVQFSIPGFYIIDHQASTAFPIVLAPASGTGTQIGAPWWRKCHIFFDGTNVDYANPPEPGETIDLHGLSAIPNWMTVCSKQYALLKDGTSYSTATFQGLFNVIGTVFGGSGGSFQVPDERARMRVGLDTNTNGGVTNRMTAGGGGVNGTTMGAAGGNELLQSHNHASPSLSDPGHAHGPTTTYDFSSVDSPHIAIGGFNVFGTFTTPTATTGITLAANVGTTGSGSSQNMPPTIVSFLPLIKT